MNDNSTRIQLDTNSKHPFSRRPSVEGMHLLQLTRPQNKSENSLKSKCQTNITSVVVLFINQNFNIVLERAFCL